MLDDENKKISIKKKEKPLISWVNLSNSGFKL
jgi:hypothetical protein